MKNEIINVLADWNTWWETKEVPINLSGVERDKSNELKALLKLREIKIVVGVRRCGKSTLFYQIIDHLLKKGMKPENVILINFEDAALAHYSPDEIYDSYLSQLNPENGVFVFIDEVQKKKEWERWIRKKYDLRHAANFFVSGSSASLLKKEYSTLLTGRNLSIEVFPLSFREFLDFSGVKINNTRVITTETKAKVMFNLKKYLDFGGFPEIFFKEEIYKRRLLNQYFEDIIFKDVVDRYNTDSGKTKELGVYFLTNICNPMSMRKARNSLGLGMETLSLYTAYMAEAYLIYQVAVYSPSLKVQAVNPKKIYCIDTGLRNAVSYKFSDDLGRLAENTVFIELKRRGKEVYYWKDDAGREVDFIVKDGLSASEAIQVCWDVEDEKTRSREMKPLYNAMKEFNLENGIVITEDFESVEENDGKGILFVPIWKWLLNP